MDILNFLYLKKQGLVRTTANNADTDLVPLGADVTFAKRDDQYQTYAMPLKNFSVAGDVANTAFYTLDYGVDGPAVTVTTQKGVIEITNFAADVPDPALASATPLIIQNADITFGNPDNLYLQLTPYYRPALDDTFVPYIIATGAITGQEVAIFNISPDAAGADQGEGLFYVYYELYQF
jgi:hypothetical protein